MTRSVPTASAMLSAKRRSSAFIQRGDGVENAVGVLHGAADVQGLDVDEQAVGEALQVAVRGRHGEGDGECGDEVGEGEPRDRETAKGEVGCAPHRGVEQHEVGGQQRVGGEPAEHLGHVEDAAGGDAVGDAGVEEQHAERGEARGLRTAGDERKEEREESADEDAAGPAQQDELEFGAAEAVRRAHVLPEAVDQKHPDGEVVEEEDVQARAVHRLRRGAGGRLAADQRGAQVDVGLAEQHDQCAHQEDRPSLAQDHAPACGAAADRAAEEVERRRDEHGDRKVGGSERGQGGVRREAQIFSMQIIQPRSRGTGRGNAGSGRAGRG